MYQCKGCQIERFYVDALIACPDCGVTGLVGNMRAGLTGAGGLNASAGLAIAADTRTWKEKWSELQTRIQKITQPRVFTLDKDSTVIVQQEFSDFFISCYHLKDALKKEVPGTLGQMQIQEAKRTVEAAINSSRSLSIVADLCNSEKHAGIDQPQFTPRSGSEPIIKQITILPIIGSTSYLCEMKIEHAGVILNGSEIAKQAMSEWLSYFTDWSVHPVLYDDMI